MDRGCAAGEQSRTQRHTEAPYNDCDPHRPPAEPLAIIGLETWYERCVEQARRFCGAAMAIRGSRRTEATTGSSERNTPAGGKRNAVLRCMSAQVDPRRRASRMSRRSQKTKSPSSRLQTGAL